MYFSHVDFTDQEESVEEKQPEKENELFCVSSVLIGAIRVLFKRNPHESFYIIPSWQDKFLQFI